MTLTTEEKKQLECNCKMIRDYLIGLVKDYPTNITISVKFYGETYGGRTDHPMGISVEKRGDKYEVYGYTGGLGIKFDGKDDYNHTLAWEYEEYGINLINHWSSIKPQFIHKLEQENQTRSKIVNFKI